jgi:glucose-6-phosphate isomerase
MPHRNLDAHQRKALQGLLDAGVVERIWRRDPSVWEDAPQDEAARRAIVNRLGWLTAPTDMLAHVRDVQELVRQVRDDGMKAAYLLGMGGSSLCAEVLKSVHGTGEDFLHLDVLDTTDEGTLSGVASRLDPAASLFLVASKSGGTVEVASMERFFHTRLERAGRANVGPHFVAITDPGTSLERLARDRGYRRAFLNPPDIGGRFSALSLFGLVPAALIGVDLEHLLASAAIHADGCRQANQENPGAQLGAFIGTTARAGRDKLTVILPPSLGALGLWIEQLVAESTGKGGTGALPVVDEPLGRPDEYGADRAFVAVATEVDGYDTDRLDAVADAGHPVFRMSTRVNALGAEFFRWEFATAIAGAMLKVNPFDEPNVTEAKDRTRALLDAYRREGRLPEDAPVAADDSAAAHAGSGLGGRTPADVLRSLLSTIRPGDYVAFLSYLPPLAPTAAAVHEIRLALRARTQAATTVGVGPRYLHSTGQYHKGGPDTGLFIIVTADDEVETAVPDAGYSFAVLKRAQALGDFQALAAHGRRAIRLHLKGEPAKVLRDLFAAATGQATGRKGRKRT